MSTFNDEILAIIQKVEAAAYDRGMADGYHRGKAEVKADLLRMLTTGAPAAEDTTGQAYTVKPVEDAQEGTRTRRRAPSSIEERVRAPRGIVPALVNRVLASGRGYFPKDILENAATDYERMVKSASIRSELNAGKERGIYRTEDGKWFLSSGAGGEILTDAPPASEDN